MSPLLRRIIYVLPVPKAVVYRTDSLATCEPDDPTEAFMQGIPNHPANHPSTLFLRSYKHDLIFCIRLLKDTTICVATSVPDSRMRLSEGRSMSMINRSKPGHSLQDSHSDTASRYKSSQLLHCVKISKDCVRALNSSTFLVLIL